MTILTKNEKKMLVYLILSLLIAISISLYFTMNCKRNNKLNSRLYVIYLGKENSIKYANKHTHYSNRLFFAFHPSLFNSFDMILSDLNTLAKDIVRKYDFFDKCIIVCNEDMVTYVSSSLPFILENLSKSIIITSTHLDKAITLSSKTNIPEVMVASNSHLLRGCRTVHKSPNQFISPNYPPIVLETYIPNDTKKEITLQLFNPNIRVIIIKLFPGNNDEYFITLFNNIKADSIILEIYGEGNTTISPSIVSNIEKLVKKGMIIVAVSQNNNNVTFKHNNTLKNIGVLSGHDMTTEATYAKLYFLLSNVDNKKIIIQLVEKMFRGEISD